MHAPALRGSQCGDGGGQTVRSAGQPTQYAPPHDGILVFVKPGPQLSFSSRSSGSQYQRSPKFETQPRTQ